MFFGFLIPFLLKHPIMVSVINGGLFALIYQSFIEFFDNMIRLINNLL